MLHLEKLFRRGGVSEVRDTGPAEPVKVKLKLFIWSRLMFFPMKSNYLAQIGWAKSGVKSQDFCPLFNQYHSSIFHIFYFSSHFWLEAKEFIWPRPPLHRVFHLAPLVEYLESRKGPTKGDSETLDWWAFIERTPKKT